MNSTCFAIMPFNNRFDVVSQVIKESAKKCGLRYIRGDRRTQPGVILQHIISDIENAAVIVADVSDHNSNVFYELGIAHHLRGTGRVVIITQAVPEDVFDISAFRQLTYKPTPDGYDQLRKELPSALKDALASNDRVTWSVIRGRMERTGSIIKDLKGLVERAKGKRPLDTTIRLIAGLGSLAISEHEPIDPVDGSTYNAKLIEERNALRGALLAGAELKAILNPPRPLHSSEHLQPRHCARYERLIGLLEGKSDMRDHAEVDQDIRAIKRCRFALSPVPMPNLFIIGGQVAYEGVKRGGRSGFEMTHCETKPEGVEKLIEQFDMLFADSLSIVPIGSNSNDYFLEQLKRCYAEAAK